jgi:pectate lyase
MNLMIILKRYFLLGLVFLFIILIAGCGAPSTGGQPTTKKITIEGYDEPMIGFAISGQGTTGGQGGEVVVVHDYFEFFDAVYHADDTPRIVLVDGTITYDPNYLLINPKYTNAINIASNKTILGLGDGATISGISIRIGRQGDPEKNIIIRNITFDNAPDDNISIWWGSSNVWIDHCTFKSAVDSNCDITRQANYVTLSWNRFENVGAKGVSIVGGSDTLPDDANYLRVTYHHNFFNGTAGRNPRMRYGIVHIFNNYYTDVQLGPNATCAVRALVEYNYFERVQTPTQISTPPGFIVLSKEDPENGDTNIYLDSGTPQKNLPTLDQLTDGTNYDFRNRADEWLIISNWIPYSYTPDNPNNLPNIILEKAGAGKIRVKYE